MPVYGIIEFIKSVIAQVVAYFLCEWIRDLINDKGSKIGRAHV